MNGADIETTDPFPVTNDKATSHRSNEDIKNLLVTPSDATFTVTNDTVFVAIKPPDIPLCHKDLPDMRLTFRSMEEVNSSDMAGHFNDKTTPDEEVTYISSESESQVPERDDEYYLSMVNFEFDNVEFLVPRWRFRETSQETTLILPREEENRAYTQANVSALDFCGLMEFMYPMWPSEQLSRRAWISVLKLASGWHMVQYREQTLNEIEGWPSPEGKSWKWRWANKYTLGLEEKVILGCQCGIPAWYQEGCVAFARGDADLMGRHEATIGIDAMVKIWRARDMAYQHVFDMYHEEFPAPSTFVREARIDLPTNDEDMPSPTRIIEDICTARKNGPNGWLQACYGQLIDRRESVTLEEITLIGLDTTLCLWKARFKLFQQYHRTLEESKALSPVDFTTYVDEAFSQELADIRVLEAAFDQRAQSNLGQGTSPWGTKKKKKAAIPASPWGKKLSSGLGGLSGWGAKLDSESSRWGET